MEQTDNSVETIVLSSDPVAPHLTPAEARCVARIRARRRRLRIPPAAPQPRVRRWWPAAAAALLLAALLLL